VSWIIVKKFPLEADLSAVTGYLRQRRVAHQIYEEAGAQVVAVMDPAVVEPLQQFLEGVVQGTIHLSPNLQPQVAALSSVPSLWEQIKSVPVTGLLILLSALGAALVELDKNYLYVHWLTFQNISQNGFVPLGSSLKAGEVWRLVTPVFLHFGFFHVLFNCLWLWDLCRRIEFLLGKKAYFLLIVCTGILSNTAQYVWSEPRIFGGMSGVVYALVGFIMVSHKLSPHRLTAVPSGIIIFMLAWLVICMTNVVDYFIGGGVANAAHLGGLLAGFGAAVVTTTIVKINSKDKQ
jgi:GlpG protein